MNGRPTVSVILPVYNCFLYIAEAVNSILNQTFSDFELIIIDDASNDGTVEILKNFNDSRIHIIFKEKNQGVSSATNDGFKLAKGKYIARMDGDDISVKERFEKQVRILENNPKIIVCSSWIKTFGSATTIIKYKENHKDIITELLISCSICMPACMFRREVLSTCLYDVNKFSGEDYDFWTKVAWLGELYSIPEPLLLYRLHAKQASIAHKQQQVVDDVAIRLYLFKKIKYDQVKFSDLLISKMLLLNEPITIQELDSFVKWLNDLELRNKKSCAYPIKELRNVLHTIKRTLLFNLYFKRLGNLKIDKNWRLRAIFVLPLLDVLYILKLKGRELIKITFKE